MKKYGGDVPAGAMRTELRRVGSIEESENGSLTVKKRFFWPGDNTEKMETALVHHVYPLLCNVVHNTDPENEDTARAQLAAYSLNIQKEDRPRLRRMCSERLVDIAASFDDLFMAYETRAESSSENDSKPVMVGLYYFEEDDPNVSYEW